MRYFKFRNSSAKNANPGLTKHQAGDSLFRIFVSIFAMAAPVLAVIVAFELFSGSRMAWSRFGSSFLWTSVWDPVAENFGALPFLYGTVVSSAIALAIAFPLGIGSAVFLTELAPRRFSDGLGFIIELIAAVPSVILGLMGIYLLAPAVKWAHPFLEKSLGFTPFFKGTPYGVSLLAGGLILAIMILPYITVMTREVLLTVPQPLKEAMLAVGATRWEMVWKVSLPFAKSGIIGAVFLALGRALGETMAVTMVIGNTPKISPSLLEPSYTMAAVIANELAEAAGDLHLSALIAIGFSLFVFTLLINAAARLMIYKFSQPETGK